MNKILLFVCTMMCGVTFLSCDKDEELPVVNNGKMGGSYWSSKSAETENEYHTIQFSGTNDCRVRHYITSYIDLDYHTTYQVMNDSVLSLTKDDKAFGNITVKKDGTLLLIYDKYNVTLHSKEK